VRTFLSKRKSGSFQSTITYAGTLRFMMLEKPIDAPTLIQVLRRLCRDAGRKAIVILDILSEHAARDVRAWVADHADEIVLSYKPSYALELNPDEYLNGDLKLTVAKRAPARNRGALLRTATNSPSESRSSFDIPTSNTSPDVS